MLDSSGSFWRVSAFGSYWGPKTVIKATAHCRSSDFTKTTSEYWEGFPHSRIVTIAWIEFAYCNLFFFFFTFCISLRTMRSQHGLNTYWFWQWLAGSISKNKTKNMTCLQTSVARIYPLLPLKWKFTRIGDYLEVAKLEKPTKALYSPFSWLKPLSRPRWFIDPHLCNLS